MQRKSNKKEALAQAGPETPEQKKLRLVEARAKRYWERLNLYKRYWLDVGDECNKWKKKAEEYEQLYYQQLYDQIERIRERQEKILKDQEKMLKRFEPKLIEHDLVPGKSKIKIPCDNCKMNGNCKFQDIYTRNGGSLPKDKLPCWGLGPIPIDPIEGKIHPFPFNLVDSSIKEEILN